MKKLNYDKRMFVSIGIAFVFILLITGCNLYQRPYAPPPTDQQSNSAASTMSEDFVDIPIPRQMTIDKEASSFFRTSSSSTTGILALKGSVTINSLVDFFDTKMEKENYWKKVSSFRSPRSMTLLMFKKEDRYCIIMISDKVFYTYAQIWVAPSGSEINAGIIK